MLQLCPTLCNPIDSGPPGSSIPGILQARTLEWVAISFSNAGKRKVKVKSLSRSVVSSCLQPHGLQPTRLLRPWDFPGKSTGVGYHCLLQVRVIDLLLTLLPGSILLLQLLIGKIMLDNNLTLSRNAYLKLHAFVSMLFFKILVLYWNIIQQKHDLFF